MSLHKIAGDYMNGTTGTLFHRCNTPGRITKLQQLMGLLAQIRKRQDSRSRSRATARDCPYPYIYHLIEHGRSRSDFIGGNDVMLEGRCRGKGMGGNGAGASRLPCCIGNVCAGEGRGKPSPYRCPTLRSILPWLLSRMARARDFLVMFSGSAKRRATTVSPPSGGPGLAALAAGTVWPIAPRTRPRLSSPRMAPRIRPTAAPMMIVTGSGNVGSAKLAANVSPPRIRP